MEAEIESDGKTVWVNSGVDGCCIGRFSVWGIDVHKDSKGQMEDGDQCYDCKAGPTTVADWEQFKASMLTYHGVVVGDEHRPRFLNGV